MESENRQWLLSIIFPATDKHRKDRAACLSCSRDDSVLSTSVSCRKLRGNRKSTGGWNVPITMCICTTAFQNAFTYITSLYCNKFGLRLAGPILQRKDLRSQKFIQKTPFPSTGALFSFPCAKAWHPLGGMKAAYLIPFCLISVQRKQPDTQWPLLCETAKTLREAPFLVLLPLYLGQSQMGMCFKLQTP